MRVLGASSDAHLRDLRAVIEAERLSSAVLGDLRQLIPADQVAIFELDAGAGALVSVTGDPAIALPSDKPWHRAFWAAFWDCLPCAYPVVSGDLDSVTTLSDFYSARELRRTVMYQLFRHTVPADHALSASLPSPHGTEARIMFFRDGHDFDERDRMLLALLRPHLGRSWAAGRGNRDSALSLRQRAVLHLVARGYSNAEIAEELSVATGTVRKHLDNVFRQLGVSSRAAAVVQAFPDGVPPMPAAARPIPLPRIVPVDARRSCGAAS